MTIGNLYKINDMDTCMAFLKRQLRELCTNYGTIHGIWWDMNVSGWQDHSVAEMLNSLQPAAVINNRGCGPGDFSTPERNFQAEAAYPFAKPTEACDSVGQYSWGYRRDEDYFSVRKLEHQISLYTAPGGNFLLNLSGILCTGEGRELNLILLDPPQGESLRLPGLQWMPQKAILLNNGEELTVTHGPETDPSAIALRHLPVDRMNDEIQVIRLEFDEDVIHSADTTVYEDKSGSMEQG